MAVARLNKLNALIHKSSVDELLKFLQELGSVEIIDLRSSQQDEFYSVFFKEPEKKEDIKALDKSLQDLSWLINFLSSVDRTKRYIIKKEKLQDIINNFDYTPVFGRAKQIEDSLNRLELSKRALLEEEERLLPWQKLDVDLKDIYSRHRTIKGLGIIKEEQLDELKNNLKEKGLGACINVVDELDHKISFLYLYIKEDEDEVIPIFKTYEIEYVYFPQCKGTPKELLRIAEENLRQQDTEKDNLLKELQRFSKHKLEAMALFDHILNLGKRQTATAGLLATEEVFIVGGWVKKSQSKILKQNIENKFKEAEVFFEEPKPKDDVPVILENNKLLEPFELITKIYGMPAYNELDPTPFLAPFFFLFFGFCITDAAYGIILTIFSLFVLKKFKMGWMGNRFFRLLLYGGISAIILGAVTGGWFGNAIQVDSLVLLDPMKEPMKLLIIALCLGILQIWFGHFVAVLGNVKNHRYLDAIMDQGSMFIFLFGFTGAVLYVLNTVPKHLLNMFIAAIVIGSISITLTAGRANPTIGSKLFYGLFTLYSSFSGYISDVLSYSRLWALGLVTGVMAQTTNMVAVMIGKLTPFVGFVLMAVIFLGGHIITLAMNLLSAFIHPLRLQFVEFFTKFFRGGGRDFKPLSLENKFTVNI